MQQQPKPNLPIQLHQIQWFLLIYYDDGKHLQ